LKGFHIPVTKGLKFLHQFMLYVVYFLFSFMTVKETHISFSKGVFIRKMLHVEKTSQQISLNVKRIMLCCLLSLLVSLKTYTPN
jgi:hypothetical protein